MTPTARTAPDNTVADASAFIQNENNIKTSAEKNLFIVMVFLLYREQATGY